MGYDDQANTAHSQTTRRPEGFRAMRWLAALLLGRRPMKGILPRRASASSSLLENSTPRNFQTGSESFQTAKIWCALAGFAVNPFRSSRQFRTATASVWGSNGLASSRVLLSRFSKSVLCPLM